MAPAGCLATRHGQAPMTSRHAEHRLLAAGSFHFTSVKANPVQGFASRIHVVRSDRHLCRFQPDKTSPPDATASTSFDSKTSKRMGPLLLALDTTEECRNAVQWALSHLCGPHSNDEVEIVHVVCDPRTYGTATSVGVTGPDRRQQVVRSGEFEATPAEEYTNHLLGTAYQHVTSHCGELLTSSGVRHQFHLPRLDSPKSASSIGQALIDEAERLSARALVVASHGPGAMAEFGSVASYCCQHASVPVVLIPSSMGTTWLEHEGMGTMEEGIAPTNAEEGDMEAVGKRMGRQVVVVVEHMHDLETHWQWVADNICRPGDHLHVLQVSRVGPYATSHPVTGDVVSPALNVALKQALQSRGVGDVSFGQMTYENVEEVTDKVCEFVGSCAPGGVPFPPPIVVVLNYSRPSSLRESVEGSVSVDLAKNCPVPLILLQHHIA